MNILKYRDPPNADELSKIFDDLKAKENLINSIKNAYPDWIVDIIDDYSADYPVLKNNWEIICKMSGNKPQKILLVEVIYLDIIKEEPANYTLLIKACDYLTFSGYILRRLNEFIRCKNCGLAIPSKDLWTFMKNNEQLADKVPKKWSKKCSTC